MATLRCCIIVHVEPNTEYSGEAAVNIGDLAEKVGAYGAKVSVQFGRKFLDQTGEEGAYEGGVTSLACVLAQGGNFWCHCHDSSYNTLSSTYTCVKSAYDSETSGDSGGVLGRSGGADLDASMDWVSITQARGLLFMNSATQVYYAEVDENDRPYAFTNDELKKLYSKGQAPGPLYPDVWTLRTRPFWMKTADKWTENLNTIYPQAAYAATSSVVMIPAAGHLDLPRLSGFRTANPASSDISVDDLKAALTQVWTTYSIMSTYQGSITNVWYTHIPQNQLNSNLNSSIGAMVNSINNLLGAGMSWHNMNEIGSLFLNPSSFNY